ncbi:MAG TPA: hypothetical protein VF540_04730 [Segetibacter sp.]
MNSSFVPSRGNNFDVWLMENRLGYKKQITKVIGDFQNGVKSGADGRATE